MSGKITGGVWDLDLPRNKALVLLAMADHADHLGGNVYPSFGLIAWKTGYSYRQVLRIVKDLEKDAILVLELGGKESGKPNRYRINLAAGKLKPVYDAKADREPEGYDTIVSYPSNGVTFNDQQGGYDTIESYQGMTSGSHTGYDIQESHEPSFKPSIKPPLQTAADEGQVELTPEQQVVEVEAKALAIAQQQIDAQRPAADDKRSNIFTLYEKNIGIITPMMAETLKEAEKDYPPEWIREAIEIAVGNNARKWSYVSAILGRWSTNGYDGKRKSDPQPTTPPEPEEQEWDYIIPPYVPGQPPQPVLKVRRQKASS